MGTQSKGRRGQQDSAAERSTGVAEARVGRAGIAPGVQAWNSDKLWEGITHTSCGKRAPRNYGGCRRKP